MTVFFFIANQKEVRRVTVLHRSLTELHNSEGIFFFFYLFLYEEIIFYNYEYFCFLYKTIVLVFLFTDESTIDSKVPVRFRLGHNKQVQESKESKVIRKTSKRQGRKVKHKIHLSLKDPEHIL